MHIYSFTERDTERETNNIHSQKKKTTNEIKQPNRKKQRESCCFYWRSMLIMTWSTSRDIKRFSLSFYFFLLLSYCSYIFILYVGALALPSPLKYTTTTHQTTTVRNVSNVQYITWLFHRVFARSESITDSQFHYIYNSYRYIQNGTAGCNVYKEQEEQPEKKKKDLLLCITVYRENKRIRARIYI